MILRSWLSFVLLLCASAIGQDSYTGVKAVGLEEDSRFNTKLERPAYATRGPSVLFDRRHARFNFQQQFLKLLKADGYRIFEDDAPLNFRALSKHDVLIFVEDASLTLMNKTPAVTEGEASAIHDWVKGGGALLVASNGTGAEVILRRFHMHVEGSHLYYQERLKQTEDGQLLFESTAGALANHLLLNGRDPSETVHKLVMLSPETATIPEGGVSLVVVSPETVEEFPPTQEEQLRAIQRAISEGHAPPANSEGVGAVMDYGPHRANRRRPMVGRAPLIAAQYGKGRLVFIGNPSTIAAQVLSAPIKRRLGAEPQSASASAPTTRTIYLGMSSPEADNRQFALNVLHWLSRSLN